MRRCNLVQYVHSREGNCWNGECWYSKWCRYNFVCLGTSSKETSYVISLTSEMVPNYFEIVLTMLKQFILVLWDLVCFPSVPHSLHSNTPRWSNRCCGLAIDWWCIDRIRNLEMVYVFPSSPTTVHSVTKN